MDLYSARIHQLSGAQGALLPLLIRLIPETISAPWEYTAQLLPLQRI